MQPENYQYPPQQQPYPYPPQQQAQPYPYPYAYPTLPAPPAKQFPVPEGRRVPAIWAVTLIVLAVVAALLALFGGLLRPLAPAPYGNSVYASKLAQDDGAWQFTSDPANQCAFANGSLDATANDTANNPTPSCSLNNHTVSDFHLSVRLLPPADANNTFLAGIYVRYTTTAGVAFFITNTGIIEAQVPGRIAPVLALTADQWHENGTAGNVFVIQAQGSTYTLAMNGVEIYAGDFNGVAESESASGSIALTAAQPQSGSTEARFADFALTTP